MKRTNSEIAIIMRAGSIVTSTSVPTGAVKLGYRDVLAAIEDLDERREKYEEMVAAAYAQGKATNTASMFEIDDVIDPADTRRWIVSGLKAQPPKPVRTEKKRPWIDTW